MTYVDEESYQEMIRALQNFMAQTSEHCGVMESAGKDCVDNTDNDPAAVKGNEKLGACLQRIRGTFETVQGVIEALQRELEQVHAAAAKADRAE